LARQDGQIPRRFAVVQDYFLIKIAKVAHNLKIRLTGPIGIPASASASARVE